jgi:hypothetical protein
VFVSITRTDTTGTAAEDTTIVGEEMDGWLRGLEGYRGLVLLSRPGETLGLAYWESREAAERQSSLRAEFRERMIGLAGGRVLGVEGYEITFSRVDPEDRS